MPEKKSYEKPELKSEKLFENTVLSCSKYKAEDTTCNTANKES